MKKEIKVISSFLIIFLFLTLNAHADFRFQVRIVQFQPTDAPAEKVDIVEIAKGAQEFYRGEMQRHGYGPKTFRVEKFAGEIRVHTVNGKHPIEHYTLGIREKIRQELPAELKRENNTYIIVVNGLQGIEKERFIWYAQSRVCSSIGGDLYLAGGSPHLDVGYFVQGLGWTFGILHNILDPKSIMQVPLIHGQDKLSDYEARWLNKSQYFNPPQPIDSVPEIKDVHPVIVGRETIRVRVDFSSRNGLHQAIAIRHPDVIAYAFLSGAKDTAHFQIEKNLLKGERFIGIQFMDIKGNYCYRRVEVDLAASVDAKKKKLIPWAILRR